MKKVEQENCPKKFSVIVFSSSGKECEKLTADGYELDYYSISHCHTQDEYLQLIQNCQGEKIVMIDIDRQALSVLPHLLSQYTKETKRGEVFYWSPVKLKWWGEFSIKNWGATFHSVSASLFYIADKEQFLKAYGACDLSDNLLVAVGYSLQKNYLPFKKLNVTAKTDGCVAPKVTGLGLNYTFKIPFRYLTSGSFFKDLFQLSGKVQRNMVFRMLIILFACFTFCYMPYISKDYGVTGDEYPDHQHTAYVLNYFANGDTTALYQPKTTLHLYGISMQVVAGAICRWFNIDNYYEARHVVCAFNGALGVLFVGLAGLRWGGGLCGLLSILLMFFTPRFFGHSMNNLKDIPFATGYIISIYYAIRLFDYYPYFRIRDMIGAVLGIALALGTRSGGLILYPMLLMYAGLFYIRYYGLKEFYKFGKYQNVIGNILTVLFIVLVCSYILAIALWPFALQKPLSNVLFSLREFTNYSIGLRTIFDGEQMMSNMLPWKYAPKYLMIGMPLVIVAGFIGYLIYVLIRRKEFSLISYFLLFAAIFPVIWVIYKNSNLYGGIRHLLFVMPPMVLIAGRFWQNMIDLVKCKWGKLAVVLVFIIGLSLPVKHMVKNHPNDYIYFNELIGGLKGAYGDYETDYYYNSLKDAYEWFRKNVDLPKDRKTIIVTNHVNNVAYYFRKDTNVRVIYSRYYEKYSKDWDYAMFANVYINRHQLKSGLFPPEGTIYAPETDGFPMATVVKRQGKEELEGFRLESEKKYDEALKVFLNYIEKHPKNEEVMSRIAKLSYMTNNFEQAEYFGKKALELHPSLNETLYMLSLTYMQGNKLKEAMECAQGILDENVFSVDGYYLKAMVFDRMKRYKEAIDNINKALAYRPNFANALALGGEILYKNANYTTAINVYNRLLQVRQTVPDLVRLADCYCRVKQYAPVQQILSKVNEAQPGYLPAGKVELRMLIQQKNWKNVSALLDQMATINDDSELFVLRGLYLFGIGKQGEAVNMIDKALQLDKENTEARQLQNEWKVKMK